ncbi:ParB/RepB/Spo0J family partition protein [Oscillospiraceae bacterium CLA-AA-H272]|jgi:ParB family chromosome partitioning protein|uniref:ParB/RepB/Spo0J family partition protein n=1 Tax=Brotocaccenecus cirricatena TaxID=3064195 RepID=A0AAE3AE81_9FIRM|nr:ParB/RepB/Spo0J family partition protein [Brotocaccenecus cirricatena]MCC2129388.1 ParB/RepB/Spo0J family partition protein [Brotocaccenecus cirricatena]
MKLQRKGEFLSTRVQYIPLGRIRPNPQQPRRSFDEEGLAELAASIRSCGILQPLTVRRAGDGYELVAGERRLRAARIAGLREVPCLVAQVGEEDSALLALMENLQRRDLDCWEEAQAIARLISRYGLSQEEAARRLGRAQPTVANKLRLLRLPEDVRALLRENGLTERHARALLRLQDPEVQRRAAGDMVRRGMNVAQAEAYVEKLLQSAQVTPPRGRSTYIIKDVRLFLNSVDRGLHLMRQAGVDAGWNRQDTDREILLTIRIPKRASGKIDSVSESC